MASLRTVFSDSALQAAIDHAVASIPAGQDSALVAHADLDGASLSVVVRVADHWTIQAAAIKPWTGPISAEAEIVASW
jgi:hypothetical protein